jgi:hypothetical protein
MPGGPLVGLLSEFVFGYSLPPPGLGVADMPAALRRHNARALGKALFFMTAMCAPS